MNAPRVASQTPKVLVVTASDSRFFALLRGMLTSLQEKARDPAISIVCLDIGLDGSHRAELEALGVQIAVPRAHLGVDAATIPLALLSFLARPFLPEDFPGYDVYVWIDSDVWLQDTAVLDAYVKGAQEEGMAITHERTSAYRFQLYLLAWTTKHFLLGYGMMNTAYLLTRRHVNAGFFAIRADAPHWQAWADRYAAAMRRTGALVPHDQFALNQALHGKPRLPTRFLSPRHNWICDRGIPMWNDTAGAFCEPVAPYRPIGAMHLAGPAKRTVYRIKRTGGGSFSTGLIRGAGPANPAKSPL